MLIVLFLYYLIELIFSANNFFEIIYFLSLLHGNSTNNPSSSLPLISLFLNSNWNDTGLGIRKPSEVELADSISACTHIAHLMFTLASHSGEWDVIIMYYYNALLLLLLCIIIIYYYYYYYYALLLLLFITIIIVHYYALILYYPVLYLFLYFVCQLNVEHKW